jgi:GNAT superfamily N-acetyltransferase
MACRDVFMNSKSFIYQPLSKERFDEAIDLVKKIFPSDGDTPVNAYRAGINKEDPLWQTRRVLEYYLVIDPHTNKIVALTGLYSMKTYPLDEIWLGWFGVEPAERGKGIGKTVLEWTIAKAKSNGYKHFKLWTTDSAEEAVAQRLYEATGFDIYNTEKTPEYTILYRKKDLE